MSYPIIGLTTRSDITSRGIPFVMLQTAYIDALTRAGAIPVLIPSRIGAERGLSLLKKLDGVLFTGGTDIDPIHFNGEPHPRIDGIDVDRDTLELELVRKVVEEGKPFMGICRGSQIINVALGGSLYTDLTDQKAGSLKHDYFDDYPRSHLAHTVRLEKGTRLAEIVGEFELTVNSLHHQGAKAIPQAFRVAALAPDGLVEAMELLGHPFGMAIQWHPEWLTDQPHSQRLFSAFVEAAAKGG